MRPHAPLAIAFLMALAIPARGAGAEEPPKALPADPVERTLLDPPATGLAVLTVATGSQAEALGILPGEIVTAYDGAPTTTMDALRAAAKAAVEREGTPEVKVEVVASGGAAREVTVRPGLLGVTLTPVTKGKGAEPLPPSTEPKLDFARVAAANADAWYVLTMGDAGKCGFEHGRVRLQEDRLVVDREVAFDGGKAFGLNHFLVTVTMTRASPPELVSWRFENPLTQYVGEGRVETREDGSRRWVFTASQRGEKETKEGAMPPPPTVVPTYAYETLAAALPREAGACLRLRELVEGGGQITAQAALVAVGEEEISLGAAKVKAWRTEARRFGGVKTTFWTDAEGRVLRGDYVGAVTTLATKEEALAGLPAALTPRTAN